MSKVFHIRPVNSGDAETVRSLLQQEADHNGFSYETGSPHHPQNAAASIIGKTLDPKDNNFGWLAFADNRPAGIITTPQGLSGGVFIAEEFRRRGIAEALVLERERYFKEDLGWTYIERPVHKDNLSSINLHKKLGYQISPKAGRNPNVLLLVKDF